MKDENKAKHQVIDELAELRQRVAELEASEAECKVAEEALRESEEWYHDLIESAHDMIQSVALDGRFVFVNGAWLETLGYTEAELPDLNLWTIIHPESLLHCQEMFSRVVAGESIRNVQATFLTKDGRSILVEGNVSGRYTGGELVATHGFFRDITERKRAEEALWESEERFRSLFENSTIGLYRTAHDGRILLGNPTLVRMLGYSSFDELALRNLEEEGFKPDYPRSRFREQIEREGEVRGLEAAWTRRDGSVIFVRESAKAIRDADGTILYYEGTVEDITERKRAEERLQHSLQKLRKALGGIIQAVTLTVEARDPYTAGHQRRMTNLARAIATEMGLSEEQIDGIRMAGAIHDLGKISVPAGILNKPGRLTEHEFGIIQAHPQVGYDILKTIEFPWPVAQIVFQHHERMDGSGYPRGLVGEEILLEARVLAVADVVEAMSSHRPYRPALGIDKALEEISQNRGVLYDPEVVDACLRLFAEKGFKLE